MFTSGTLNHEVEIFPKVVPAFYFDNFGDRVFIGYAVIDGVNEDNTLNITRAHIDNDFMHLIDGDGSLPVQADIRGGILTQVLVTLPRKESDVEKVSEEGEK